MSTLKSYLGFSLYLLGGSSLTLFNIPWQLTTLLSAVDFSSLDSGKGVASSYDHSLRNNRKYTRANVALCNEHHL